MILPLDGGPATSAANFGKDELVFSFQFSNDGRHLFCARGTVTSDVYMIENFRG
ncbi:MAG: hypothetical protein HY650_10195 [Acidobacteria bacterium]|nr:hypothetical protein [Acidobacteriota bacterium]